MQTIVQSQLDAAASVPASRREFIVAGAMISAAATSKWLLPSTSVERPLSTSALNRIIPERFGRWYQSNADDVFIPTADADSAGPYDALSTRYYANPAGDQVIFLLAYGSAQAGDAQLHRPEVCYPAAGFSLSNAGTRLLKIPKVGAIAARAVTATLSGRVEQILYWSRVGSEFPTDSWAQRWSGFRQSMRGAVPDGALVRMSMISVDQQSALGLLEGFAEELLATSGADLRRVLVGRA